MKLRFIFLLLIISSRLSAQPLLEGWSEMLLGKWKVDRIDTIIMASGVNMFLDFQEDKLLMINPSATKEAQWKANEASKEIYIKTQGDLVEAWQVRYIDKSHLQIFDTIGFSMLYLSKYDPLKDVPTVPISRSEICGTWLLLNIDGVALPRNVNLELQILASGTLKIKIAQELQIYTWKFNAEKNGVLLLKDNVIEKEWLFSEVDNKSFSFYEKGRKMNFTRYNAPLSSSQEKSLVAKWKIMEVEGSLMPNNEFISRYMELNSNSKMYFYSNDKKEGEGNWGINSTKSAILIISGGGTELWNIYHLENDELLLELEGIKMLLKK
jgi:hypothetical protein